MRIYIAAPWVEREKLPAIARVFEGAGHTITERWWEHEDVPNYPHHTTEAEDKELGNQATRDLLGVFMADAVVLINSAKSEGKAVETGLAIAAGMPVIVVGPRSNIFHWMLPPEFCVDTIDEALRLLSSF